MEKRVLGWLLKRAIRFCNCGELEDEEWAMVGRKGSQFVMNGRPFYVNGFNTYWLMIFAVDASTRGKVSEIFQQASSVGLSVCRTWAFNDGGWRALQKSPGIYDEDVFKGLDFVISEAKRYKIRLILSLSNNWEAYGGKAQYVKWGRSAGLNLTSDDDFFSDPILKGYFKSHIKTVLTRVNSFTNMTYKDDATIFAWEMMNEPRCLSDPSGDQFQAWVEEMAMYVKSIDQAHLLGIGSEGFYGPSSPDKVQFNPNTFAQQIGTDFLRNHKAFAIDFASAHIYADTWISSSISDAHLQFTKTWMESHINDTENALGMPILFSEFGVSTKDSGYNDSFRDTLINTVYSILLSSTKKGGSGEEAFCGNSSQREQGTWMMVMQFFFPSHLQQQQSSPFNQKEWICLTPSVLGDAIGAAGRKKYLNLCMQKCDGWTLCADVPLKPTKNGKLA